MADELRRAKPIDRILYFLGRRHAVLVEGDSMAPTLTNGDTVLVDPSSEFNVGDIVLAKHPYKTSIMILKRVTAIGPGGELTLTGDNPAESTDSRTFGAVQPGSILGKVVGRLG